MSSVANVLSTSISWTVLFGVFLMNVQLGQNAHQRDIVDHATAVAADSVTKTLCASAKDYGGVPEGVYEGPRRAAVMSSVTPLLGLVAPPDACRVRVTRVPASAGEPARRDVDVDVSCDLPCRVPFAAEVMCHGSPRHVTLQARQRAVAMGCDSGLGGG